MRGNLTESAASSEPTPSRHAAADRDILKWLRCLADPLRLVPLPAKPLPTGRLAILISAALHHMVLPIVIRRLRSEPDLLDGAALPAGISDQLAALAARSLLLSHQGDRAVAGLTAAGIPATLIKGPIFARRLYPDPALRPFSDIDILVPRQMREESRTVMRGFGFNLIEQEKRAGRDYHEDQWILPGRDDVLVEIQDDLVHAPSLTGMSLSYADLMEAGSGDPCAATSLLMTAAVHGAVGHQFEFLRFVLDVCQAARGVAGPIDAARLNDVSRRNGTRLAVAIALDLAGRFFFEPSCRELADRLGDVPGRRMCRLLLSPGTVLRAQGPMRHRDSWRRKALRETFKRHSRAAVQARPSTARNQAPPAARQGEFRDSDRH